MEILLSLLLGDKKVETKLTESLGKNVKSWLLEIILIDWCKRLLIVMGT